MTKRRPQKKLTKSIHVSAPVAIACAVILGIAHVGVELYNDFHPVLPAPKEMQVCFTPDKGCQKLLLKHINNAKKTIHVQAFSFTDPDVGTALMNAKNRGVSIKVLADKSNPSNKKSLIKMLARQQVPVRIDSPQGIAHNKIMIIDESTVITGSYNFSKGAYERNAENLLFINDSSLAKTYMENWQKRWGKGGKYP